MKGSPHFWGNRLYAPSSPFKIALSPATMTFILAVYFSRGMELQRQLEVPDLCIQ